MENVKKQIDSYLLLKELGRGMFGTVYLAFCIKEKQYFAVKTVSLASVKDKTIFKNLKRELKMLLSFKNDNIIRLFRLFKSTTNFNLVLDYANGGNLTETLHLAIKSDPTARPFSFALTTVILRQLITGLLHMNSKEAVHRDLKTDNILFHYKHIKYTESTIPSKVQFSEDLLPFLTVRIADLGFTRKLQEESLTNSICGTPLTMAPEMMDVNYGNEDKYNSKVDMWSLGVIFFQLLQGKYPFWAETRYKLYESIKDGDYVIDLNKIKYVEEIFLIEGLLRNDPTARLDCKSVSCHPLLTKQKEELTELSEVIKEFLADEEGICKLSSRFVNVKVEICKETGRSSEELETYLRDMMDNHISVSGQTDVLSEVEQISYDETNNVLQSEAVSEVSRKMLKINFRYFE